jgi:hypothetical protein
MATEYMLKFFSFDSNHRLISTEKWFFVVNPSIEVLRVEIYDDLLEQTRIVIPVEGKRNSVVEGSKRWRENYLAVIKAWLFRRESAPFDDICDSSFIDDSSDHKMWSMVPSDFTDEDKDKIKFQWFQEDI